jgi:hypothetical protein
MISSGYASPSRQARTFVTNPPPLPAHLPLNRSELSLQAINNTEVKRAPNKRNKAGADRPRSDQGAKAETAQQDQPDAPRVKDEYGDHDQDDVIPHDTPANAPYQNEQRTDSLTPCPEQLKHSSTATTTVGDLSTSSSETTLLDSSQRTGDTLLDSNESTNTRSNGDDNGKSENPACQPVVPAV